MSAVSSKPWLSRTGHWSDGIIMGADDYIREMEALFSEAEAKEQRAQESKGAWLHDQFEMLRKAINMTPRDFETPFRKDNAAVLFLARAVLFRRVLSVR